MLDLYTVNGQIVLRHGMSEMPGIAMPIDGTDILFYDVFKEFTDFLKQKESQKNCETITIILESYVKNNETYTAMNQTGLADKYLYKNNPNLARLEDVCNKIIVFTSHTKDSINGIHPPRLFKENHFRYYKDGSYLLKFEECEERAEGRAHFNDTTVSTFCFNHFSPFSALIEKAILLKPLLYKGQEAIDSAMEAMNIPLKSVQSAQDFIKAYNALVSLTEHLDKCREQDIKDSFFPTIIAVDFIEKESGVFLCCGDSRCLKGENKQDNEVQSQGFFQGAINYISELVNFYFASNDTEHQDL